jgi:hypothetical protein
MYSSTFSWPRHELKLSGKFQAQAALPPGTHWIGGWMSPIVGLDDMEKWKFLAPPGLELRTLGRPTRRQSLYRLNYHGSNTVLLKVPININEINVKIKLSKLLPHLHRKGTIVFQQHPFDCHHETFHSRPDALQPPKRVNGSERH